MARPRPAAPTDFGIDPPRKAPTARLFTALWPGPATLRALVDSMAGWSWPAGAALVPPERLHITLHFIGAVPCQRLAELTQALALPCQGFAIELGRAELWPRGLAVLSPLAVPPAMIDLHARLAQALRQLDLPVERRAFRPHLTLARQATGAVPPGAPARIDWRVNHYALVQSADGYRTLARYPD